MNSKIEMREELFLGDGNHKEVYIHPQDKSKCVKLLFTDDDPDMSREFRYRRALGKHVDDMPLLTKYYGTVETDKGIGYVFERVMDYDGACSRTLLAELEDPTDKAKLEQVMQDFHREFMREKFAPAGVDPDNFLVQRVSPEKSVVRIIDNIGTSAKIPLEYYVGFLAKRRAKKYWNRLVADIARDFPDALSETCIESLWER
ncbi:YrbL family protein [Selenomonas ruminantium]|uniref:PhoP regulatory network protein YrbL n=1 Tax=Selenomonas ruminantium TaxID=971 RepID=A0A1H0PKD7_SELRU|nr:YrbL family protein [Selenomonas ruminantium]SDP05066.1 PhoP regulatory network protein YrbL [Selenomonas ruminantium]